MKNLLLKFEIPTPFPVLPLKLSVGVPINYEKSLNLIGKYLLYSITTFFQSLVGILIFFE
jgi:hypothetical protein